MSPSSSAILTAPEALDSAASVAITSSIGLSTSMSPTSESSRNCTRERPGERPGGVGREDVGTKTRVAHAFDVRGCARWRTAVEGHVGRAEWSVARPLWVISEVARDRDGRCGAEIRLGDKTGPAPALRTHQGDPGASWRTFRQLVFERSGLAPRKRGSGEMRAGSIWGGGRGGGGGGGRGGAREEGDKDKHACNE